LEVPTQGGHNPVISRLVTSWRSSLAHQNLVPGVGKTQEGVCGGGGWVERGLHVHQGTWEMFLETIFCLQDRLLDHPLRGRVSSSGSLEVSRPTSSQTLGVQGWTPPLLLGDAPGEPPSATGR